MEEVTNCDGSIGIGVAAAFLIMNAAAEDQPDQAAEAMRHRPERAGMAEAHHAAG